MYIFLYIAFSNNKALVETTWLSRMDNVLEKNYEEQIINYIENNLKIRGYKINYKEQGAIHYFIYNKKRKKYNQYWYCWWNDKIKHWIYFSQYTKS